jgi:exodeoxyribonuclease VII large subunit
VIGVVTSSAGAVWHDIQNVVRRRYPFARLRLAPAAVQGDSAPADLIAALQSLLLSEVPDVIVIARGGGSASDLAAFNDENLVRAVFAIPVPVVSAIGHETDWTLLDLVADLRAPTPSAAAEIVTPSIAARLETFIESLDLHITRFERDLAVRYVDVERTRSRLEQRGLRDRNSHLDLLIASLLQVSERHRHLATERSTRGLALLEALSPAKTLERGYAFVEHVGTGRPVRSASEPAPGDVLRTRFFDGSVDSIVTTSNS